MSNQSTGQSFSTRLTMTNPDVSSAEWIAEAPSSCEGSGGCTPLPLTNFGTAAVSLTPGAGSSGFDGVDLPSGQGSGSATPSSLSSDGSAFSVAYSASATGTSTSTSTATGGQGSGDGYGYGYGYGGWSDGGYGYGAYAG